MSKYLTVCDLDESLLTRNKKIKRKSIKFIHKYINKGNYFILCTVRPYLKGDILWKERHKQISLRHFFRQRNLSENILGYWVRPYTLFGAHINTFIDVWFEDPILKVGIEGAGFEEAVSQKKHTIGIVTILHEYACIQ